MTDTHNRPTPDIAGRDRDVEFSRYDTADYLPALIAAALGTKALR